MDYRRHLTAAFLLSVVASGPACAQSQGVLAGIDHVPVAVRDLEAASADFKRLGFSIKPGRDHATGIRNRHIKFPDGSGLELITVGSASDELSASYLDHLKAGDGPAYVSFHVRNTAKLTAALVAAGIEFNQVAGLTTFKDPRLAFVFITPDNRSPTDRPEHFAHPNGAFAMSEVWIACEDMAPLKGLLLALGATSRVGRVRVPEPAEAEIFELQNGRVVALPGRYQLRTGRPVIGIVMSARPAQRESSLVEPDRAHGLWLEFQAAR